MSKVSVWARIPLKPGVREEAAEVLKWAISNTLSEPGTLRGSDLDKGEGKKSGNLSGRTIRIEMPDF